MSKSAPPAVLRELFSIVLGIGDDLTLTYVSPLAGKNIGAAAVGSRIDDVFTPIRPNSISTLEALSGGRGSLFLLKDKDDTYAIRGQLVLSCDGRRWFVGAPWLAWLRDKFPGCSPMIEDFPIHDAQMDQLFLLSSERLMVSDLEALNADLERARDESEAAHTAKDRFFAHLSHEMRTPLNGLISALELMQDRRGTESEDYENRPDLLRMAITAANQVMDVVNTSLDVSSEETDDNDRSPVDIRAFVAATADIVRPRAEARGIDLDVQITEDVPARETLAAGKLRAILLNLLGNALDFTKEGVVSVFVGRMTGIDEQGALLFKVTDTGPGIAQSDLENIFKPYWSQREAGQFGQDIGTGLGLDIVKRHCEEMGAHILVDSKPGLGTTFSVMIPSKTAPVDKIQSPAPQQQKEKRSGSGKALPGKVLLVDDNETNLMLGCMLLESLGHEVFSANNGQTAIDMAAALSFDIILMDMDMPDMNGAQTCREILNRLGEDAPPILAMTAFSDGQAVSEAKASGMQEFITKPITAEALDAVISAWLEDDQRDALSTITEIKEERGDVPLVDDGVVDEIRRQVGQKNLSLVVEKLGGEIASRTELMRQSVASGNVEDMRRQCHAVSATLSSLGLSRAGAEIETLQSRLREAAQQEGDASSNVLDIDSAQRATEVIEVIDASYRLLRQSIWSETSTPA